MKIVTAAQMRELDRRTQRERGIPERTLIARAGRSVAEWIAAHYPPATSFLVLAGKGNNGADALVAGRDLARRGRRVRCFRAWNAAEAGAFTDAMRRAEAAEPSSVVIDGLLGTGLNRPIEDPLRALVDAFRSAPCEVVSLDLPSGLHPDTGHPFPRAARARHTLALGLPKLGVIHEHAADHVGEIHVLDLGFPEDLIAEIPAEHDLLTAANVAPFFAARRRGAHKGDFGRVVVIGGAVGMAGAPALAARAALRAGAGRVHLLVPSALAPVGAALAGAEVMTTPVEDGGKGFFTRRALDAVRPWLAIAQAVVLGPGMGRATATRAFAEAILRDCAAPVVADADALDPRACRRALREARGERILTPHPGEMARLAGCDKAEVSRDRFGIAGACARTHRTTVVLKGARTLVAHPRPIRTGHAGADGREKNEVRFSVNALAGNPGMASGGVGDALAGVLAALLARGLSAAEAARAGVWLHARAGDLAMPATGGGIAGDLIDALPRAMAEGGFSARRGPGARARPCGKSS